MAETGVDGRRASGPPADGAPRSDAVRRDPLLGVHACAVIVAIGSAVTAGFPFLPFLVLSDNAISWQGLVVGYGGAALAYLLLWDAAHRGNRFARAILTFVLVLAALAAGIALLLAAVNALSGDMLAFTWVWWARVVTSLATIGALVFVVRGEIAAEGEPEERGGLGALTWVAGFSVAAATALLFAWTVALLAPPQGTPGQAVAAVSGAMGELDTRSVDTFRTSLQDQVSTSAALHPRDRWRTYSGFRSAGEVVYRSDLQWGSQLTWRDQWVCVARRIDDAEVVVLRGYCPA